MRTKSGPAKDKSMRRQPPPNYFSRREQYRLLVLVSTLMLVLVLMNEARKPTTWAWMWAGESTQPAEESGPIDTLIQASTPLELPVDGFQSPPQPERATPTPTTDSYLPGITPELLSDIEDNSVMRARENKAWVAMFRILQEKTAQEIESLTTGKVGFIQLFRQPDVYRGKIITCEGLVHRLESIASRPNEIGMERIFRWVIEPAGGANAPIVVFTLDKPEGLEPADQMREHCTFTGFFFKRWAYGAADGMRLAPLVVAKTAAWQPPTPAAPTFRLASGTLFGLLIGLGGLSTAVAFAIYRTTTKQRADIQRLRCVNSDIDQQLHGEDIKPGVAEALHQLAGQTPNNATDVKTKL